MHQFQGCSSDLCASLAFIARRICSSYIYVNPSVITPLLACHLIALNKHLASVTQLEEPSLQQYCPSLVLIFRMPWVASSYVRGKIAGIEAAVHATRSAYESKMHSLEIPPAHLMLSTTKWLFTTSDVSALILQPF